MGGSLKIQEKAEASKKKYNEISGKPSSFSILNSVDPQVLRSIAIASNISLGEDDAEVANSTSLIQANENARVALLTAKKRIMEKSQKEKLESDTLTDIGRGSINNTTDNDTGVNDGGTIRPSKKPPIQAPASNRRIGGGQNKKKEITTILFWNIRGMGAMGRRNQLRELRHRYRVDAICLQETIKKNFSVWDLQSINEGETFEWSWTATMGHAGEH
jgi:hypothetical protein